MTLIIEDGSIVADANSYSTVDELNAYAAERGVDLCATEAEAEALLIRAMDYINAEYGYRFQGSVVSDTQSLHFPRYDVWIDGVLTASDSIPRNLQYGQLAAAIEANTNDLLPNATAAIRRQRVEGAVEVEYAGSGKVMAVSSFQKADALLRPLAKRSGMFSVRA